MLAHRDSSADPRGHTPIRQCALTRARAPKHALLRLALGPDRVPYVDLIGRAPGRGVYVTCAPDVVRKALSPKGLGRTFRGRAAPIPTEQVEEILEDTIRRLENRLVEMTGIARRAGLLELGMDPVLRALRSGGTRLLIATCDLGDASVRKIESAVTSAKASGAPVQVIRVGTKADLGSMLGRSEVGVVAIRPSRHAERMSSEADRWLALKGEAAVGPEIPLTDPGHPEQSVGGVDSGKHGAAVEVK